jgi:hypothetical protein
MKIFLLSLAAAVVLALVANVILTNDVQETARLAFTATSASP